MALTQGLHGVNFADGTNKLINIRYGIIKDYNSGTVNWDHVESPHFDFSALIDTTNFLDHAFFVNGEQPNYTLNSSSTWSSSTNVTNSPKAKYVIADKTRVYLGNIKINDTWYRSRVAYSDFPKNGQIVWGMEMGTDLVQTSGSAVVTSASSLFDTNNIKVGDPLTIETGANAGEYTVRTIDSETQITLTESLSSTVATSTFWVGGNWFDVRTDDGDVVTGFGLNSNEVVITKRLSFHRYNSQSGTLRQIKSVPGTGSGRSIVDLNEYTYYYDPTSNAIRRFNGSDSIIISNAVEDLLENMAAANKDNVVGWSVDGKLVEMYIGTTSTRDGETITYCTLIWDTVTNTWSTRSLPFQPEQATTWVVNSKPTTYISTYEGKVLKVGDGYQYDSTDIAFELTDQVIFPEGDDVFVDFERLRVFIENGRELQVVYKLYYLPSIDNNYKISDWIPLKGKATGEMVDFFFSNQEQKRACGIQLRFIQSSAHESFLLEKYKIYYSNPALE